MLKKIRDILMNVGLLLLVKNLSLICKENLLHSLSWGVLYTMNYRKIIEFQNCLLIHFDINLYYLQRILDSGYIQ